MSAAKFSLGQCVATPGALEALAEAGQTCVEFLARHQAGDWGELAAEDVQANAAALTYGYRLMSVYTLRTGVKIRVLTEHDRSVSTLMLPQDY